MDDFTKVFGNDDDNTPEFNISGKKLAVFIAFFLN